MTKKVIRLTESDLHKIVNESVKRILKESYSKDKPITYDLGNGEEDKYQTLRYNGIAVGTIDHTHKTVSPMHGYFYPNPISKDLMRYAKKLGYEYAFDDNWEKEKNSKKKSLMEGFAEKYDHATEIIEYFANMLDENPNHNLSPKQKEQVTNALRFLQETDTYENPNTPDWIELAQNLLK